MLFDLAIIGAGPAGCAAAITSARNGARVLLLESGQFPRHKVCGEFVSAESLDLLATLLGSDSKLLMEHAPRISRARIFLDERVVTANIAPSAASITRYDLDVVLWKACLSAGVCGRPETRVSSIEGDGPFRIETSAGTFDARSVVNGSGRWSNFSSPALRSRLNENKWVGIKAHFREQSAPASVDLYFFDGGYCGVQPVSFGTSHEPVINVCAMVSTHVARSIDDVVEQNSNLLARSRNWTPATKPVVTSPLIFHPPEPVRQSMLNVGDAATFVDPFIGDGISLALRSGALAAQCLDPFFKSRMSLAEARNSYAAAYGSQLSHVFRASSKLRGFLSWPSAVRKPVLTALARAPFLANQIVRITR